mgnify:CR=1 FL=1
MATNNTQKLKLLHLMDVLRTETDPEHGLTMPQIIEKLGERGVSAERKSLYKDIDALREFGMDVRTIQKQPIQYCLAERDFELSHIMLLVDAVQSSRFLSDGSAKALVKSIRQMASVPERAALNKQVHVYGRPSRQNQSDFIAVDKLQDAIAARRKVSFRYFKYDAEKKRVARKSGATHVVTPMSLVYSDGNYYLVAYSDADGEIRNYRVDRMEQIAKTDEPAERNDAIRGYDPEEAGKCAFGMYDGERVSATFRVDADLMNVVVDRFGRDVWSRAVDSGAAAEVHVAVKESPVFYGWLTTLGSGVEVLAPESLKDNYLSWLQGIAGVYGR